MFANIRLPHRFVGLLVILVISFAICAALSLKVLNKLQVILLDVNQVLSIEDLGALAQLAESRQLASPQAVIEMSDRLS